MTDEVENLKSYIQENLIKKTPMTDSLKKAIKEDKQRQKRQKKGVSKNDVEFSTANVVNFPSAYTVPINPPAPPKIKLSDEIIVDARTTILEDWQRHAKANRLLEYFIFSLPIYTRPDVNYLNNMTEIVKIERQMGYTPKIYLRGSPAKSMADFFSAKAKMGYHVIHAPEMLSEEHARAIMVLIYNKVRRDFLAEDVKFQLEGSWTKYPPLFDSQ